jgi:hypothetical protein
MASPLRPVFLVENRRSVGQNRTCVFLDYLKARPKINGRGFDIKEKTITKRLSAFFRRVSEERETPWVGIVQIIFGKFAL